MTDQFHIFYHSIKESDNIIYALFIVFLGWQFLLFFFNQISQGYEKKDKMISKVIEKIKSKITLESSVRTDLMMSDFDNWKDGKYLGDLNKIDNQTESILRTVERWQKRGSAIRNKKQ